MNLRAMFRMGHYAVSARKHLTRSRQPSTTGPIISRCILKSNSVPPEPVCRCELIVMSRNTFYRRYLRTIPATLLSRLFESYLSNETSASIYGQDRCKEVSRVSRDEWKYLKLGRGTTWLYQSETIFL